MKRERQRLSKTISFEQKKEIVFGRVHEQNKAETETERRRQDEKSRRESAKSGKGGLTRDEDERVNLTTDSDREPTTEKMSEIRAKIS
jgi:hypothetical protein